MPHPIAADSCLIFAAQRNDAMCHKLTCSGGDMPVMVPIARISPPDSNVCFAISIEAEAFKCLFFSYDHKELVRPSIFLATASRVLPLQLDVSIPK